MTANAETQHTPLFQCIQKLVKEIDDDNIIRPILDVLIGSIVWQSEGNSVDVDYIKDLGFAVLAVTEQHDTVIGENRYEKRVDLYTAEAAAYLAQAHVLYCPEDIEDRIESARRNAAMALTTKEIGPRPPDNYEEWDKTFVHQLNEFTHVTIDELDHSSPPCADRRHWTKITWADEPDDSPPELPSPTSATTSSTHIA